MVQLAVVLVLMVTVLQLLMPQLTVTSGQRRSILQPGLSHGAGSQRTAFLPHPTSVLLITPIRQGVCLLRDIHQMCLGARLGSAMPSHHARSSGQGARVSDPTCSFSRDLRQDATKSGKRVFCLRVRKSVMACLRFRFPTPIAPCMKVKHRIALSTRHDRCLQRYVQHYQLVHLPMICPSRQACEHHWKHPHDLAHHGYYHPARGHGEV
mmetsp:Transcript_102639/g.203756  ORF Transcript_102639/g.203756 Transcript_102639/m.203756 type:complete len:209 (+) Transcript_102639:610-1236(+)